MSELSDKEIEEIWKFVNVWFDLDFSSDETGVIFTTSDKTQNCKTQYFNKMEIEAHSQQSPDTISETKDAQIGLVSERKWFAMVYTDRLNGKNRLYQEFLRNHYSRKNYIEYLLIHEFIHVLERLTNKELLTKPTLDIKIFLSFHQSTQKTT